MAYVMLHEFSVNITVHRNGNLFGPYTLDQINTYLVAGKLFSNDIGWYEGAVQWVPLGGISGVIVPPAPPPPLASRSTVKLAFLIIVWTFIFWFGLLVMTGFMAGVLNPKDGAAAGRQAGESLSGILFLLSLALSIWFTHAGKLPGTKSNQALQPTAQAASAFDVQRPVGTSTESRVVARALDEGYAPRQR